MTTKSDQPSASQKTDWYLQNLVDLVTKTETTISITLMVGGSLITGKLISGKEYFSLAAEQFASALKAAGARDEDVQSVRAGIMGPAEAIYSKDSGNPFESYNYVHLKDVRIFSSAKSYQIGNVPWRGHVSSVDGFFLGELSGS